MAGAAETAGAGASGVAASGRTTCEASTAGRGAGCRFATAAGGGAGGAAGGRSVTTKAGAGAAGTQALTPVAATAPGRVVAYCVAIPLVWAPVRTAAPGCTRPGAEAVTG